MNCETLQLLSTAENLSAAQDFLSDWWQRQALPADQLFPCEMALEEIFTNIVNHGVADHLPTSNVTIAAVLRTDNTTEVILSISDDGQAFDLTTAPTPNLESSLDDRAVGGLGVHLVQSLMDDVHYQRLDNCNVVTLRKTLT